MAETLVDPSKCTVDGPGVQNAEVSTLAHFSINIPHTSGKPEPELEVRAELKSLVDDSTTVQVTEKGSGIYDGTYIRELFKFSLVVVTFTMENPGTQPS